MAGAHVFPGGRVDDADRAEDVGKWCDGVGAAAKRIRTYPGADAIAFHVAAVRELFEEAGVLLARDSRGLLAIDDANQERLAVRRRDLLEHRLTLAELAQQEGVRLALDALVPFAHWITPDIETRRFDTYFFFAAAPPQQHATHDQRESTHGAWIGPREAIARCTAGEMALPPPTWTTLRALSAFGSIADAQAWAEAQHAPRVQPNVVDRGDGTRLIALPGDPLCPAVAGFEAREKRFLLERGRWRPVDPD